VKQPTKPDLNCDLGEGEPPARTRSLMRWITSANVACGGHAGNVRSMRYCVRLAREFGVKLGAHPGIGTNLDFGRSAAPPTPAELELLLLHQVSALETIAAAEDVSLHHIKLHGALYHAVEADARLARVYLRCVQSHWPKVKVYSLADGRVRREARRTGVNCRAEGFADRAYLPDGQLVPRSEPGAVIADVTNAVHRVRSLLAGNGITAVNGRSIPFQCDTICVHADTPNAPEMARALARLLR
jgi:UPF0271 protein